MSASERALTLDDGKTTTVQSWGDAGPVVLCVHGIASSRRDFVRLGERLASSYRVFAYDQRGHGDSAGVAGPMTLERSVADLRNVAASLPEKVDLLVGHSWGGAVAILGGRAILPRKVVAIDPMIYVVPGTFEDDYVDGLREPLGLEPVAKEAAIREMYEGANDKDIAGKVHAMKSMRIEALESLGRDNKTAEGGWDLRVVVAGYPIPLLILKAGDESVISDADLAGVEKDGGKNVTVRTFENDGHTLHRSAFEEFASAVEAFAKA